MTAISRGISSSLPRVGRGVIAFGAFGQDRAAELDELAAGLTTDGVNYGPIEATLEREQGDNVWITLSIREGKNREVRRIMEHLGLSVNRLIRVSFGPFMLGDIEPGQIEEVKTSVLKDQLGPRLARQLGVSGSLCGKRGDFRRHARSRPICAGNPRPGKGNIIRKARSPPLNASTYVNGEGKETPKIESYSRRVRNPARGAKKIAVDKIGGTAVIAASCTAPKKSDLKPGAATASNLNGRSSTDQPPKMGIAHQSKTSGLEAGIKRCGPMTAAKAALANGPPAKEGAVSTALERKTTGQRTGKPHHTKEGYRGRQAPAPGLDDDGQRNYRVSQPAGIKRCEQAPAGEAASAIELWAKDSAVSLVLTRLTPHPPEAKNRITQEKEIERPPRLAQVRAMTCSAAIRPEAAVTKAALWARAEAHSTPRITKAFLKRRQGHLVRIVGGKFRRPLPRCRPWVFNSPHIR